ncbi:anthrax toxin lethal factor-related metalloendopeptidase [Aquibacillus kalidii]|uniref:anthrax toxin lethal factor-related metalloendopeptidase n=1 Tax=Aquibacillus kalidii TaxID=2762597 RepID=UPI0016483098|nr:toxin [Aquibacillus kalidii]
MKNKLCAVIVILFFSFLSSIEITRPFYGILLEKAFGQDDLLKLETLENADLLSDLVIIPEKVENRDELILMVERINGIDRPLLKLLTNQGVKVRLFEGKLTDEPLLYYLKWQKPRGWDQDVTWEKVPGSGGSWLISAKIGASMQGSGHSSINLELHEIGHTIFKVLKTNPSLAEDFQEVWHEEVNNIFPDKEYFINYSSEYFAEMFAYYYYSERSNAKMKYRAPKTYQFFVSLPSLNMKSFNHQFFHSMNPLIKPRFFALSNYDIHWS